MRIPALALLVALLAPHGATASVVDIPTPPGWKEVSRNKDLVIFYKDNEQFHARDVLAYTEIDATPEQTWKVVTDFDHYPEFMPYVRESHILTHLNERDEITYQLMSAPLISDRDYYLKCTVTPGSAATGGVYKTQWFAIPDYQPERKGIVRMRLNEGSWTFEPIDGGKRTRIVYALLTDPAGAIPKWMVNMSSVSVIPNLFDAVRKRVAKR